MPGVRLASPQTAAEEEQGAGFRIGPSVVKPGQTAVLEFLVKEEDGDLPRLLTSSVRVVASRARHAAASAAWRQRQAAETYVSAGHAPAAPCTDRALIRSTLLGSLRQGEDRHPVSGSIVEVDQGRLERDAHEVRKARRPPAQLSGPPRGRVCGRIRGRVLRIRGGLRRQAHSLVLLQHQRFLLVHLQLPQPRSLLVIVNSRGCGPEPGTLDVVRLLIWAFVRVQFSPTG